MFQNVQHRPFSLQVIVSIISFKETFIPYYNLYFNTVFGILLFLSGKVGSDIDAVLFKFPYVPGSRVPRFGNPKMFGKADGPTDEEVRS